jgi:ComF family protein
MVLPVALAPFARWIQNLSGAVTSVVFPAPCRLCGELLTRASRIPICDDCLSSFIRVPPEGCEICGQPWMVPEESGEKSRFCHDCCEQRFAFRCARSFGLYQGALVRAILLLKYERIEPLGAWFAARLAQVVHTEIERLGADVVVPVPLHRQRRQERGFNQVDLFGRPLASLLGVPYHPVLLMRSRPRPEKHLLRNGERWEEVRGAFAIRAGGRVDNLRVLLLDDVMTTGATLDACSRALGDAGAESVLALTVARAVRPASPAAGEF